MEFYEDSNAFVDDRILDAPPLDTETPPIRFDDIFIAVVGMTGAGKTHFISQCTQQPDLDQGHSLYSSLTQVSLHSFIHEEKTVHLVDTPGFDDTKFTDEQTLQELAFWLTRSYEKGVRFSGAVYLHRITDPRMQGSALRGLNIFKKLCGKDNFRNVVLATTRWDEVSHEQGRMRQEELRTNDRFWGDMIAEGSHCTKIDAGRDDAINIIDHIIGTGRRFTLLLQHEMVEEKKKLKATDAGKLFYQDLMAGQDALEAELLQATKNVQKELENQFDLNKTAIKDRMYELRQKVDLRRIKMDALDKDSSELRELWSPILLRDIKNLIELATKDRQENLAMINTKEHYPKDPHSPVNQHRNKNIRDLRSDAARVDIVKKQKHGSHRILSSSNALIGTALGIGQIVAMAACTVM